MASSAALSARVARPSRTRRPQHGAPAARDGRQREEAAAAAAAAAEVGPATVVKSGTASGGRTGVRSGDEVARAQARARGFPGERSHLAAPPSVRLLLGQSQAWPSGLNKDVPIF